MRYTIKWKFLLKLAVVVLVAGTAVFFLHRWQVSKQVDAFLNQANNARDAADREKQAGDKEKELAELQREQDYLRRFATARPDDVEIRERLGRVMVRTARNPKQLAAAYYFLEDVLRRDSQSGHPGLWWEVAYYFLEDVNVLRRDSVRDPLRRETVELGILLELYQEAERHLDLLLKKKPDDGELLNLYATCLLAEKKYADAEKRFDKAVEKRPDLLGAYEGLAVVRRLYLDQKSEADHAIRQMVAKNPKNFRAHLIAAKYWREYGTRNQVSEAVNAAYALAPNEVVVLVEAADVARTAARATLRADRSATGKAKAEEHTVKAREYLKLALAQEQGRKMDRVYLALASLEAEARQVKDAIAVINTGLAEVPNSRQLLIGLLDYQYQLGDKVEMAKTLEKLKSLKVGTDGTEVGQAELEEARLLTLQDEWAKAATVLTRSLPKYAESSRLGRQANILLGQCYEQLGRHANRLDAYNDALNRPTPLDRDSPLWTTAMLGVADAQAALGRGADALATYRKMSDSRPGVWVRVARLELFRALTQPDQAKRDYKPVEDALRSAEAAVRENIITDDTEVRTLRAILAHYQKGPAEARKLLEALRNERPKEASVWIELAYQDLREGKPEQALATLAAAEKELGDSVELRLSRAAMLSQTKDTNLSDKFAALAAGGKDKFGVVQNRRLLRGLAEAAVRAGVDAGRYWDELAVEKSFDMTVHLARFDRAARSEDAGAMERVQKDIAAIDGDNGQFARFTRALILLQKSLSAKDRAPRDQALALLDGLERDQVGPPLGERVTISQALIHELNGNLNTAIEKYEQFCTREAGNREAVQRLVALLERRQRPGDGVEAQGWIAKLGDPKTMGADMQRIAAVASLRVDDPVKALQYAREAVKEDSKDYRDQIWLGRVYWSAGDKTKPEARFRAATQIAPEAMETWLILMEYLVSTDRREEAEKVFAEAREKVKKADQLLFVATAHANLGQGEKAAEAYKQARLTTPGDLRVLFAEGEFQLRNGKLTEAREAFERVIQLPEATEADRGAARSRLTLVAALDPTYSEARKAVEALKKTPASPNETPAQKRARAAVFAVQRDRESKLEAIRLLKENPDGRTPNEMFLMAQLYQMVGGPEGKQVPVVMEELLRSKKNQIPLYTGFYAMWLIRDGRLSDARRWVDLLAEIDGKSLQTAELKARIAMARGGAGQAAAVAALRPHMDDPKAPLSLLSRICEDIGLYDQAEELLKKAVDQVKAKEPAAVLTLADYYGRRKETAKALKLWDEWHEKLPSPVVGAVAVTILNNAAAPARDDLQRVAKWIEAAAERARTKPDERAALLQHLAAVRNLQNDYAGAASQYYKALADNPRDVLAMNNLAYLIAAEHKKYQDALDLIAKAKAIIGPNPELRDTEALVLYLMKDYATARQIMEGVVVEQPSGTAFFHLALMEDAMKNRDAAGAAWRRAIEEMKLKIGDLHPLEHEDFNRLKATYGNPN